MKDYWRLVEEQVLKDFPSVYSSAALMSPSEADAALTEYSVKIQDECISDARRIFNELVWHMMTYTQTNPYGCNFRTLQDRPSPMPVFVASYDVVRIASWHGWSAETVPSEKAVVLRKDGRSIRVQAAGPHRTSIGSVTWTEPDGSSRTESVPASWLDSTVMLPMTLQIL